MTKLLECQHFLQHCSLCLSVLHNNFDSLTKLFLDLYLAKFLDISDRSFRVSIGFCIIRMQFMWNYCDINIINLKNSNV